ncbi:hypothetical protein [Sphingobacterium sp. xlx-130]|uniref:hypothetical protein n=1 Tax=Sphingobacterium sp. xlx-130 TaxID=2654323 RepID=UPI0013D905C4|nr:hypothetical protein [Sphingobacterium sp. xlx-130]
MRFINIIQNSLLIAIFIFCTSCSKETHEDDIDGEIKTEKFDQGTIEMGVFSQGVDLSKLVGKLDFSHTDPKSQYQTLLKNDKEVQAITNVVEQIAAQNPIAGLALSMNATACTYYIKGDVVLGKVKGFGWEMDNFHDQQQDKGSLYLETLTRTDEIAETDKKYMLNIHLVPTQVQELAMLSNSATLIESHLINKRLLMATYVTSLNSHQKP